MRKVYVYFIVGLMCVNPFGGSIASEQHLRDFFVEVSSLQARFDQEVVDETGTTLDISSGVFSFSRPGKFLWNYDSKDAFSDIGQQIISDGEWITFYDPDLETANQRALDDALRQVPTLALVQNADDIDKLFTLSEYGLTDGLTWVALKPRDIDAAYQGLLVGFDKKEIRSIMMTDGLGNETRLRLSKVQVNQDLDEGLFSFSPGPNVDLVREGL